MDTITDEDGEEWEVEIIDGDEDLLDIMVEIAQKHYLPRYL